MIQLTKGNVNIGKHSACRGTYIIISISNTVAYTSLLPCCHSVTTYGIELIASAWEAKIQIRQSAGLHVLTTSSNMYGNK